MTRIIPMIPTRHAMSGVGLIEILVTVLVLSIGLLGVGALLTSSLRVSQGSLERTNAGTLAYEILDRMRTNPAAARNAQFNVALGAASANADITTWKARLASTLPAGDGGVACTADNPPAAPSLCTITVQWDDRRASGEAGQLSQQFVLVTRP